MDPFAIAGHAARRRCDSNNFHEAELRNDRQINTRAWRGNQPPRSSSRQRSQPTPSVPRLARFPVLGSQSSSPTAHLSSLSRHRDVANENSHASIGLSPSSRLQDIFTSQSSLGAGLPIDHNKALVSGARRNFELSSISLGQGMSVLKPCTHKPSLSSFVQDGSILGQGTPPSPSPISTSQPISCSYSTSVSPSYPPTSQPDIDELETLDTPLSQTGLQCRSHNTYLTHGSAEADNQTAPHGDQKAWSLENLPDILYVLRPRHDYRKSRHRVPKATHKTFGKKINDFLVLPRQISSRVEGWRLEAWMRLDRRITEQDIIDRVNPKYRLTADDIELRRNIFRDFFHVADWTSQKTIWTVARMLRDVGIDPENNSTRGLTPGQLDPSMGEAGGRIPTPSRAIPFIINQELGTSCKSHGYCDYVEQGQYVEQHGISVESRTTSMDNFWDPFAADYQYPDPEDLASCGENVATVQDGIENDYTCSTTLEEYLKNNQMSYEGWLLRGYGNIYDDTHPKGPHFEEHDNEDEMFSSDYEWRLNTKLSIKNFASTGNSDKRKINEQADIYPVAGENTPKRRTTVLPETRQGVQCGNVFWRTVI